MKNSGGRVCPFLSHLTDGFGTPEVLHIIVTVSPGITFTGLSQFSMTGGTVNLKTFYKTVKIKFLN